MRSLVVAIAVLIGWATPAGASHKTTLAVASIKGDSGDAIGNAIGDALAGKDFKVTTPKQTHAAMVKLKITGDPEGKALTKLLDKLAVDAVLYGKVTRSGKKRTLRLKLAVRGSKDTSFIMLAFTTTNDDFKHKLHDAVEDAIKPADDTPTEPVAAAKPAKHTAVADPEPDTEPKPKHEPKPETVATEDDAAVRQTHHPRQDVAARRIGASDLLLDAGLGFGQRHLTYATSSAIDPPPTVSTGAASARIDGEVYPFALAGSSGGLANLGFAASYDKTLGLSVAVPSTTVSAGIDEAHYAIGARYRLGVGSASSLVFGLDYAARHFVADRSGLMSPSQLDAPDVSYAAIEPSAGLRVRVTPSFVAFGSLGALVILSSGGIASSDYYGSGSAYGVELALGASIALSKALALRFAGELSLIDLSFQGNGAMSTTRAVTGATDRSLDVVATLGYAY